MYSDEHSEVVTICSFNCNGRQSLLHYRHCSSDDERFDPEINFSVIDAQGSMVRGECQLDELWMYSDDPAADHPLNQIRPLARLLGFARADQCHLFYEFLVAQVLVNAPIDLYNLEGFEYCEHCGDFHIFE